jgi:nucleoside-diphosphate-sugar epimerase
MAGNTDTSDKSHRANDVGTQNLLTAFGNLDSRTNIIHTSTTVFCGGRPDCSKPINELSPAFPTNEYGRTKFKGEKILQDYCREHKVRLTILRLNTTYGANSRPNSFFKLIPEMVRRGSLLSRLNWPGLTSILYVGDVAKTILTVAKELPAEPGVPETYVLHGENLTLAEICKTIHKALNKEYKQVKLPRVFWSLIRFCKPIIFRLEKVLPSIIYNPIWRACLIVDNTIYCDASKAKQHIPGWQPKTLEETVDLVVANID